MFRCIFNRIEFVIFLFFLPRRISQLLLLRYVEYEEEEYIRKHSSSGDVGEDDSSDEEEEEELKYNKVGILTLDKFADERHRAYLVPVLFILQEFISFSPTQFLHNSSWVVPLLSRLVICSDVKVRICIRDLYSKFVNGMALR